jgi:predicted flap endonuclease-1-like 5' DNA nuclease
VFGGPVKDRGATVSSAPDCAKEEHTMNVKDIEGVGPAQGAKLEAAGVRTTDELLERGATRTGREELAAATGISPKSILEWVNIVDLYRIKGVGSEFSDLLEAAAVDTIAELAQRNAKNLAETFAELDMARNTVRRIPSETEVQGWIDQAKALPRIVEY